MSEYQVLARKYRPGKLSELIGQDALARTLTHAIQENRIPHAFIMTGIRGVGKTSTARIIARSLVCSGEKNDRDAPTVDPCGTCENCLAIAQDRHVDILEMDAASRTGVDGIRDIIESVGYKPVLARYKIYIIDEVHMLSKSAFNALLKTLEEPPPHVKFIFATTEIRKIPVTILSRCMRFDLPRVDADLLKEHLQGVAGKEGINVEADALALIAHASEGSVRDALSMLDQAAASHAMTRAQVQAMLGLADRGQILDVCEFTLSGKIADAVKSLRALYREGADPVMILQDLLEFSHFLTQMKIMPDLAHAGFVPETERVRAAALAEKLSLPVLARLWQMLLKGISEAQSAGNPLTAAEMILIRIAYAAELPPPGELMRRPEQREADIPGAAREAVPGKSSQQLAEAKNINSFNELTDFFKQKDEMLLYHWLMDCRVAKFDKDNRLVEFSPPPAAAQDFAGKVGALLSGWTGARWVVAVSKAGEGQTLREEERRLISRRREELSRDPSVRAILDAFPGAVITRVESAVEEVAAQGHKSKAN